MHLFYTRDFELNGVFIPSRIDWSYRIFGTKLMYEWMLVRFAMLAALVGGGVLLAFAGGALDRWRERGARRGGAGSNGIASANRRASLTSIKTARSSPQ